MTAAFVELGFSEATVPVGGTAVIVAGNAIAVFNVDGQLFAIDDSCLRCGASLASGTLHGRQVTCRQCHWQYDVITGIVQGMPRLHIDKYAVKIVDSRVRVATAAMPSAFSARGDELPT